MLLGCKTCCWQEVTPNPSALFGAVWLAGRWMGWVGGASQCNLSPQDNSKNPISVASIMAHEMGHNLGMDHDENVMGCYCPMPQDSGGCVMAARIG